MDTILETLRNLAKTSNRLQKLIKDYAKLQEKAAENAYLLEKRIAEIKRATHNLPESELKQNIHSWIKQAESDVTKAKEDFKFQFAEQLQILLKQDGRTMRGHFPLLRIGLYTLRLNFDLGEATLFFGPEVERIGLKIAFTPQKIYEALKRFDDSLQTIKESPHDLYEKLHAAYERRLALSGKQYGEKVLVTDVLHEFVMLQQSKKFLIDPQKSHFRDYSRVKLSYMLYYLKKEKALHDMHLHVATFDATTNKQHSVWVPDNEEGEGTHYTYISFENA